MKLEIKYKIWIEDSNGKYILGPGGFALLKAIKEKGSIRAAAVELGMSYDYAWRLVRRIERDLGRKIVVSRIGGPSGGGSSITLEGEKLLRIYTEAIKKVKKALEV